MQANFFTSSSWVLDDNEIVVRLMACMTDSLEDLARMRQSQYGGAQNEDEERLFAVREFLQCEVKIPKEIIQNMKIVNIFPPSIST